MKAVLPSPQTSVSAPMRARVQCSAGPSDANTAHAPRKTSHCDALRNQNCQSNCNVGMRCRTSAESATLITHQFRDCGNVAGGVAMRATSTPRTRHATSNSRADIGGEFS
jgi:hypothetical protein